MGAAYNTSMKPKTTFPFLVTGATGFLGMHLVRELLRRGERVRAFGRNRSALATLAMLGAEPCPGDLCDERSVRAACREVSVAFHIGALSAPWGKKKSFERVNVQGTQNRLSACLAGRVRRFIYVSSPSVVFDGNDCVRQSEAAPYPARFASIYSRTKKEGEDRVNAARPQIETVILRPKAIFGPGDTSLLPRLLRSAEAKRLPQIGFGENQVDLTYVGNVVHALLLAAESGNAVGNTYTITNDIPGTDAPRLWDVIRHVLGSLTLPLPSRILSLPAALLLAQGAESIACFTGQEPFLTQYTAQILARTQTYDITAARRDLGYAPIVPVAEALEKTIAALHDTRRRLA